MSIKIEQSHQTLKKMISINPSLGDCLIKCSAHSMSDLDLALEQVLYLWCQIFLNVYFNDFCHSELSSLNQSIVLKADTNRSSSGGQWYHY